MGRERCEGCYTTHREGEDCGLGCFLCEVCEKMTPVENVDAMRLSDEDIMACESCEGKKPWPKMGAAIDD